MVIIRTGRTGLISRRSTFTSVNRRGKIEEKKPDEIKPDIPSEKPKDLFRVGFRIGSDAIIRV